MPAKAGAPFERLDSSLYSLHSSKRMIASGTKLGPYEIIDVIGAGRTTCAGRSAVKISPGPLEYLAISFLLSTALVVQAAEPQQHHYEVVHGWPVLPENSILDEVSAVAVDSKQNVFVLMRGGRKWPDSDVLDTTVIPASTIFVFDGNSGQLLNRWGENIFALPHSITIDSNDNVWVADVALHQVFKFTHDGKLIFTLGEHAVEGNDSSHFNRPSDVAVRADGSFYVSDGYGNSRVVKFSADGKFLLEWGKKGNEAGQFNLPHGIALDNNGQVFVLDRENQRVQIFEQNGKYVSEWHGPPFVHPQDIKINADGFAFVVQAGEDKLPDRTGILMMRKDGIVIERIGGYGNYDGQFLDPHWVAVAKNGDVYVADFSGKRVQKFTLRK
jgi:peptidylamidoglycolate lyase